MRTFSFLFLLMKQKIIKYDGLGGGGKFSFDLNIVIGKRCPRWGASMEMTHLILTAKIIQLGVTVEYPGYGQTDPDLDRLFMASNIQQ